MSDEQNNSAPSADGDRSRMRHLITAIDRDLMLRPAPPAERADGLFASWKELVTLLALGPEPETRICPHCQKVGMRAAKLCGSCWKKLEPLEAVASNKTATVL